MQARSKVQEKEEAQPRIEIGLSDGDRFGVIDILNSTLADEFLLYTRTRNYHWNVTGRQFHDLHKFFDEQYNELNEIVDRSAERVRSLGGLALGTLEEFLKQARLREDPRRRSSAPAMIAALLESHEALIRHLRRDADICLDKFHDAGTNNFLLDLVEKHEKMAWVLRASIEP